ncbi:sugar ABC transporter substrate-binding protein [Oscillibacter sp. CU971]|uniref:sugar ABC transporter substrate-binding protein n=1 Tax=Oscillibacter sp. CU971 TaxID=2780102 RepID=UPI00195ABD38|nr:sugar ABC transporter substrate-binding protein [Oscillibacter sp. CU971]
MKRSKKLLAFLLAGLMLTGLLSGCGAQKDTGAQPPAQQTEKDDSNVSNVPAETKTGSLTIGISTNALANIHNRHMFEGLKAEAENRGHKVVTANANGDPAQQATDVENLVQAGCDVIVIQNADNFSLKNAVQEAAAAGVRIVSQDSGWIDGIDTMFLLNSMSVQADICMLLAAEVGFTGKIITTGHQDNFALRSGYYIHNAFVEEYGFEVVAHVQTTFPGTTEVTYNGLDSALTANPDVAAIFTSQDLEAMGAIQALKEHDLYGKVKCVGVDGEVDALNDIKAGGSVLCTAISDLDGSNAAVIDACEKLMAGDFVAKYNEIPYSIVTQANVDEFLAKAQAEAEKYAE